MTVAFAGGLTPVARAQKEAPPSEGFQAALQSVAPEAPFDVAVGIRVDQIVSINQKSENFEVVGNLQLSWKDPGLAFDAEAHGQAFKMLNREGFVRLVEELGIFALAFALHNQQGRSGTVAQCVQI